MRNSFIFLFVLILTTGHIILADTGSGTSASGSLTSMPPAAPTLDNPTNHSTGVLDSDVTWNTLLHAASYNVQISTESDFTPTITDESGLTETTFSVPGLNGGVTYYWHVSATNMAGTGDYSETWDFTTDSALPVELTLFSAEQVSTGILIKWVTESETNNLGFILERASSTANFLEWHIIASYQTHAELTGQGNTSSHTEYLFTDGAIQPGETYQYRLSDVNTQGKVHFYDVIQVSLPDAPGMTTLEPPFPNPFNPQTRICYKLSNAGHVEITIFDFTGRKVQTLLNTYQAAGSYNLFWYGHDNAGTKLASGAYLIILKTANEVKKQKAILLH